MGRLIVKMVLLVLIVLFIETATATVTNFNTTADTEIREDNPNTNYGTFQELGIGLNTVNNKEWQVLMLFDVSAIPSGYYINSATLNIDLEGQGCSINCTVNVSRNTAAWSETGVTWNNKPTYVSDVGSYFIGGSFGWKSASITNLVRGWYNGTITNYGIKLFNEQRNANSYDFYYERLTAYPAYLLIDYTPIYIPPTPNILIFAPSDNFWINTTWSAGSGNVTDSYNVSVNGIWYNGTTNTYYNQTNISAHAWSNVTVYAYNSSSGGTLSPSFTSKNTQMPNNLPVMSTNSITPTTAYTTDTLTTSVTTTDADSDPITYIYQWYEDGIAISGQTTSTLNSSLTTKGKIYKVFVTPNDGYENGTGSYSNNVTILNTKPVQVAIGNKSITEGEVLTFTVSAIDADSDSLTYDTNATKGILNSTTGIYSWQTNSGDNGTYIWHFNSSDEYGSVVSETINIHVNRYRGVNISNISALRSTTNETNATYIFNLANNGTAVDSYTLSVDNPNGASTAILNTTSPVLLTSGETKILSLNVTNSLSGTFDVNVTVRSDNDSTKYGYINTTTLVNRTITDSRIENFINISTFIVNTTIEITAPSRKVTVVISKGTNASIDGSYLTNISTDSLAQVNSTFEANLDGDKLIGENISIGPEGAHFSPDIQIRFNYTEAMLTVAGMSASELRVKFYNTATNTWDVQTPYTLNETGKYIIANVSHFSTFALIGTTTTTTPPSNSGGGGGGGGGGGASGEVYENIEVKEKYDLHIFKDETTSYKFSNSKNPVKSINIIGNINAGEINVAVEVLRKTSTLVDTPASGIVYKNMNIWVGTYGFAVPKNIKEAKIEFIVNSEWLDENSIGDVILYSYSDDVWQPLQTEKIEVVGENVYYRSTTNHFSPFAISGVQKSEDNIKDTPVVSIELESSEIPVDDNVSIISSVLGFALVVLILFGLIIVKRK